MPFCTTRPKLSELVLAVVVERSEGPFRFLLPDSAKKHHMDIISLRLKNASSLCWNHEMKKKIHKKGSEEDMWSFLCPWKFFFFFFQEVETKMSLTFRAIDETVFPKRNDIPISWKLCIYDNCQNFFQLQSAVGLQFSKQFSALTFWLMAVQCARYAFFFEIWLIWNGRIDLGHPGIKLSLLEITMNLLQIGNTDNTLWVSKSECGDSLNLKN